LSEYKKSYKRNVISEDLYKKLVDYRNFRHLFRNSYLFELDWKKMKILVDDFDNSLDCFKNEIALFIQKLN